MKGRRASTRFWIIVGICGIFHQAFCAKFWVNQPAITEPSQFAPVENEALYIQGLNALRNPIHINALTQDVIVSVTQSTATVSRDGASTAYAGLYCYAATDRLITFSLTQNLSFYGNTQDLFITFSGTGNLRFYLRGGTDLSFTSSTGQGAHFLVNMDNTANSPQNYDVIFSRFPDLTAFGSSERNQNAFVYIGPKSVMSFVGTTTLAAGMVPNEVGTIAFDASNNTANLGRLVLYLNNNASMLVQGHKKNQISTGVFIPDYALLAGLAAKMQVLNANGSSAWDGLLVVNTNTEWEQLRSNPWCEAVTTTTQVGFIIGANGILQLTNNTYLDYVGTVSNYTIIPIDSTAIAADCDVTTMIKDRNPSALIIDGNADDMLISTATVAQVVFTGTAGAYFRSGVAENGLYTFSVIDPNFSSVSSIVSFTIAPDMTMTGNAAFGNIVLDVEGPLNVVGDPAGESVINIFSWQMSPTGGSVLIESSQTTFPRFTFNNSPTGEKLQYQLGCMMVDSRINFINSALQHTDKLHVVYDKNSPRESDATYIGGETFELCDDRPRPTIALYNSKLLLHTSAACAGVDILTPETSTANVSRLICYQNGRCLDNGTGRNLILGTNIGGLASDFYTVIDNSAHLDVYQEHSRSNPQVQRLDLLVSPNNSKVTQGLSATGADIADQYEVQAIYLGHETNISVGTNATTGTDGVTGASFQLTTTPTLFINGDFYAFGTQGGETDQPELSAANGQGGIFVDKQGILEIQRDKRASVACMLIKNFNGVIDMPKRQVFYDNRIGITNAALDLSDSSQLTIISSGEYLSDFTLDWENTIKDYCVANGYVPYNPPNTPAACAATQITHRNLVALPTISGIVDQFQIKNARLGDPASIVIDGGNIRELVFLNGTESANAPTGVIVLQNNAEVGLGTAARNLDSPDSEVVLGLNGVTLVANGDCQVFLNVNSVVNNVCSILTGTLFGLAEDMMQIRSVVPTELRIKSDGVFDLSAFTTQNQVLRIGGQVTLVFEPGSRLIMNGGRLEVGDEARIVFQPNYSLDQFGGTTVSDLDNFRTIIGGSGVIRLTEDGSMQMLRNSYVGIESLGIVRQTDTIGTDTTVITLLNCSYITSVTLDMRDDSQVFIGSTTDYGGVLQVGNTTDQSANSARVDFTLLMQGQGTLFDLNSQGILGFGAGVADKPMAALNNSLVGQLYNVGTITLNISEGTFQCNQLYSGNNRLASLLLLGPSGTYNFSTDLVNSVILGGGNMVQMISGGPLIPSVTTVDGSAGGGTYNAGLLESSILLTDPSKAPLISLVSGVASATGQTANQLYTILKMNEYVSQTTKIATLSQNSLGTLSVGYVYSSTIYRQQIQGINSLEGEGYAAAAPSLAIGAVGISRTSGGAISAYPLVPS